MIVGTWNVENLFTPGTGFGGSSPEAFDEKVAGLAATVEAERVDVVALQEIGDEDAFERLLALLGPGWTGRLSTRFGTPHTIRVGFASRLPIVATTEHDEIPEQLRGVPTDDDGTPLTEMGRGALHIRVDVGTEEVDLVSVHLKSKLISYPNGRFQPRDEGERSRYASYALMRRSAEATTVRQLADRLLDGEGNERHLIVMGDMNDEVTAATTQILQGPPGSEIGTAGENRPDRGDAWRLFNLAPRIPEHERYSRVYRGRGELIDHIFVSNATRPLVADVATRTGGEPLPSITDDPRPRRDSPFSDHAMVVAAIDLGDG